MTAMRMKARAPLKRISPLALKPLAQNRFQNCSMMNDVKKMARSVPSNGCRLHSSTSMRAEKYRPVPMRLTAMERSIMLA